MPSLEIFEGKSITWILLMALLLGIWYLAKFTRDFVHDTIKKFEHQLEVEKNESRKREERLNEQLTNSIMNNTRIANTLEKMENRFDNLEKKIEKIEGRL